MWLDAVSIWGILFGSMVLFLISDLDRPQEGLLSVSQEAMVDLQTKMHAAPSTTKHE